MTTMTSEREAFEAAMLELGYEPNAFSVNADRSYYYADTAKAWAIWQRSRAHLAQAGPVGDGWQPIETAPEDSRIIGCWLGAPGCHEVDVAVYVTQGVDRPRWVDPDDSFCEYGKPDLWMPLPQPPDSSDGMDYPDGPWAEGWAERSGALLPASPTPGKEGQQ